jgi:putative proteasome-type protease
VILPGEKPRLCQISPEGDFIEASEMTLFFQMAETRYVRAILLCGFYRFMSFSNPMKLMLVSFDLTRQANLILSSLCHYQLFSSDQFLNFVMQGFNKEFFNTGNGSRDG